MHMVLATLKSIFFQFSFLYEVSDIHQPTCQRAQTCKFHAFVIDRVHLIILHLRCVLVFGFAFCVESPHGPAEQGNSFGVLLHSPTLRPGSAPCQAP